MRNGNDMASLEDRLNTLLTAWERCTLKQFIDKKSELIDMVASFESQFSNPKEFQNMFDFMNDFYEVIESDSKFEKTIVNKARTK